MNINNNSPFNSDININSGYNSSSLEKEEIPPNKEETIQENTKNNMLILEKELVAWIKGISLGYNSPLTSDSEFKLRKEISIKIHNAYLTAQTILNLKGLAYERSPALALSKIPSCIGLLTSLEKLNLRESLLKELPSQIGNLAKLQELNVSYSHIAQIPSEIGNLAQLQILNLVRNQLEQVPSEIGNLAQLQILKLDYNQIQELPSEIGNLARLKKLSLASNKIESLPTNIFNLLELQKLNLGWNELKFLPEEIDKLANLQKLYLKGYAQPFLTSKIFHLTNLQKLKLTKSKLVSISSEIENLTKLKELKLGSKKLKSISSEIRKLTQLESFKLKVNESLVIPIEIYNLSGLKKLELSIAKNPSIPLEIGKLINLEVLYLDLNNLESIPSDIGKLTKLKELHLSNNKLENLPSEVGNLVNLQKLLLQENVLKSIPLEIGNATKLEEMILQFNQLSTLPAEIGNLSQLQTLDLYSNPDLNELPLSLGNAQELTNLDVECTNIPGEMAQSILDACRALREKNAQNLLPARLNKWLSYTSIDTAQKNALKVSVENFDAFEKYTLQEWLLRLEQTKDYQNNQKNMAAIACALLKTVVEDQEFKATFMAHTSANNENCPDRAAMALNLIYVAWKIHTLPQDASIGEKMDLLESAAKTDTLRQVVMELIEKRMLDKNESVETLLYCFIMLSEDKELKLLSPIETMIYETIGKRDWINLAEIKQAVLERYPDYLLSYPAFEALEKECIKNKDFNDSWAQENSSIYKEMENLDDMLLSTKINELEYNEALTQLQKKLNRQKIKFMRSIPKRKNLDATTNYDDSMDKKPKKRLR